MKLLIMLAMYLTVVGIGLSAWAHNQQATMWASAALIWMFVAFMQE